MSTDKSGIIPPAEAMKQFRDVFKECGFGTPPPGATINRLKERGFILPQLEDTEDYLPCSVHDVVEWEAETVEYWKARDFLQFLRIRITNLIWHTEGHYMTCDMIQSPWDVQVFECGGIQ